MTNSTRFDPDKKSASVLQIKSIVTFVCMHFRLQQIVFSPQDETSRMGGYELHFFPRSTHKGINNSPVWGRRCEYWSPPEGHFLLHETHKSVDEDHQPKSWHRIVSEECLMWLHSKNTIFNHSISGAPAAWRVTKRSTKTIETGSHTCIEIENHATPFFNPELEAKGGVNSSCTKLFFTAYILHEVCGYPN